MRKENCNLEVIILSNRIEYLDTAKGILIILMVTGHVFLTGSVRNFIYCFHMPAFLIVSGILFAKTSQLKKKTSVFIFSRIKSLIVPFVFSELIGVLTDIICNGFSLSPVGYVFNTLNQDWNNGADGFLIHMFVAELAFFFVLKIPNKYVSLSVVFGAMTLSFLLPTMFFQGKWGIFRMFGAYLGYLGVGFVLFSREFFENRKIIKYMSIVLSFLMCLGISFFSITITTSFGTFWSFVYIIGSLVGSYFVLEISRLINLKILIYFGRNSIIVLMTHDLLLLPARKYIPNAFDIPVEILILIGIILLEIPIIYIINRFVPIMIGRKRKKV